MVLVRYLSVPFLSSFLSLHLQFERTSGHNAWIMKAWIMLCMSKHLWVLPQRTSLKWSSQRQQHFLLVFVAFEWIQTLCLVQVHHIHYKVGKAKRGLFCWAVVVGNICFYQPITTYHMIVCAQLQHSNLTAGRNCTILLLQIQKCESKNLKKNQCDVQLFPLLKHRAAILKCKLGFLCIHFRGIPDYTTDQKFKLQSSNGM